MYNSSSSAASETNQSRVADHQKLWPTFEDILSQFHHDGIYLHPHQLAEFLLRHGLPVNLEYVPPHLTQKAITINSNYQGDMARLEERHDGPWYSEQLGMGR